MIKAGIFCSSKSHLEPFQAACILILPPKAILPIMLNFNDASLNDAPWPSVSKRQ
jgi:hypothetical protein